MFLVRQKSELVIDIHEWFVEPELARCVPEPLVSNDNKNNERKKFQHWQVLRVPGGGGRGGRQVMRQLLIF
jgi:hypothetical protein